MTSKTTTRLILWSLAAIFCWYLYARFDQGAGLPTQGQGEESVAVEADGPKEARSGKSQPKYTYLKDYLPSASNNNQIVRHRHYTLAYSEKDEQAEWVAYELTAGRVRGKHVGRTDDFRPDPLVKTGSADLYDYKRSGYDRGHICPAGDMSFDTEAISETFFMSNMSPQKRACNGGIWRELEENVRDWAVANKQIYIVSGPVLTDRPLGKIGKNKVTVPAAYFKVLLDLREPEQKAIAFLIPNESSNQPLPHYAMSIDAVEKRTGIDFFPSLPDWQEAELESMGDPTPWPIDPDRYQIRLDKWNHQ
jgi:endonuclease G